MARSTHAAAGGLVQQTVKITARQVRFLLDCGEGNMNEALRRIIEDQRTLYGLPEPFLDYLRQDPQAAGLDFSKYEDLRQYIARVLALRTKELMGST